MVCLLGPHREPTEAAQGAAKLHRKTPASGDLGTVDDLRTVGTLGAVITLGAVGTV